MYIKLAVLLLFLTSLYGHEPKLIQPGTTNVIPFPAHDTYIMSRADTTPSRVAVMEVELPPKTFGAPPHIHTKEDEHFYVIEGSVHFLNKEEIVEVNAGGLMILPRGYMHGFWNHSDKPAKMLLIITPGEFASFFDNVVADIKKQNPDNPQAVGQIMGKIAAKYGVTIHPDKIPQSALPLLEKQ